MDRTTDWMHGKCLTPIVDSHHTFNESQEKQKEMWSNILSNKSNMSNQMQMILK